MLTQAQIASHLDLSQPAVAELMLKLGINWKKSTLDEIRIAYIRNIRAIAAGHKSNEGLDLTHERVLTERIDRELKQLTLKEKLGQLINVSQLEPELMNMVGAFRAELLSRDDKLKDDLDAMYGIDVDLSMLNEHTFAALDQLARYDSSRNGADPALGSTVAAPGKADHN